MLNQPVSRKDVLKFAVLLVVLGMLKFYGDSRYKSGLTDMATYIQSTMGGADKSATAAPDAWGQGSTK